MAAKPPALSTVLLQHSFPFAFLQSLGGAPGWTGVLHPGWTVGGPPPPPGGGFDPGSSFVPPGLYNAPRSEYPDKSQVPRLKNFSKDPIHLRAVTFMQWLAKLEEPLSKYVATKNAVWEFMLAYWNRMRVYVMKAFHHLEHDLHRKNFRLPEEDLVPDPGETPTLSRWTEPSRRSWARGQRTL